jgi:hypothetical protein
LLPHIRLPSESNSWTSRSSASSRRVQGTSATLRTTIVSVGLLPAATRVGARIVSSIMSSPHGPPGAGAALVVGAGVRPAPAGDVPGAASGVRTAASDGSTCSSAGVGTAPVARASVGGASPVRSCSLAVSQPPPANRASSTTSTPSRRRQ